MEKENQRVKLTKQLLQDALLILLRKKPIQAIAIRELCQKAGVNRTTFYNHYASQYDLFNDVCAGFLNAISDHLAAADTENTESVREQIEQLLEYMSEHAELTRLLLNNNVNPDFPERVMALPMVKDLSRISIKNCEDDAEREAKISFAIFGSYHLLQKWINRDDRTPPNEQADLILRIAYNACR